MAFLNDQDKSFMKNLKNQGYSKEDAFAYLAKIKQENGDKTFTFGERFMQNLKKAPAALFGATNKIPLIGNVSSALQDTAEGIIGGADAINKGAKDVRGAAAGAISGDLSAAEATTKAVGGTAGIIGGGLQGAFAAPVAAATNLPFVGGAVESGLETVGKGVDYVAKGLGDAIGTNQEEDDALRASFNNLAMLLGAKYGPEAATKLTTAVTPFLTKAGEVVKAKVEAMPKIQLGKPLNEVAQLAAEKGVDVPLSATTGSEFIRSLEALQKNGLFSGDLLAKSEMAANKITDLTAKAVDQLAVSDLTKFDFGNIAKEGFEKIKDNFKETKNNLYDAADSALSQSKVKGKFISRPAETIAVLDELIGSSKKSLAPTAATGFYQNLKAGFLRGKITVDTLRQTLKDIGKKMGDQNDPIVTGDRASFSRIYASLSKDLDSFYTERAPAFKEAIATANTYFKENLELINGKFGSMVEKATPEQVYSQFVKPNNPTALSELKQIIGDEQFAKISGVFVKDLLEKSVKNDQFSIEVFTKELGKWDAKTLEAILDAKQFSRLQEVKTELGALKTLKDGIKTGEAKFKGSQTGFLNAVSKLKGIFGGGSAVAVGFLGGPLAMIATAVLYILGDFATSKLIMSDFMKKLVSEGVGVPGTGKASALAETIVKNAETISEIMSQTGVNASVGSPSLTKESDMELQTLQ